jgi:hypothetical protein
MARASTESLSNLSRTRDELKLLCCYHVCKRLTETNRHTGRIIVYGDYLAFFVRYGVANFVTDLDAHAALLQLVGALDSMAWQQ